MNTNLRNLRLIILLTILGTVPVNAQSEKNEVRGSNSVAFRTPHIEEILTSETSAEISKFVPIKNGSTLRKMNIPSISDNLRVKKSRSPNQIRNYSYPTKKQRFNRYVKRTIGTGLIGVGTSSVVQQLAKTPPEWEQTTKGFFKRVGSNFGTQVISETVAYGLEESFRLDSKFYKSKKKDFGSRLKNAILSSFTARTKSGRRVFNPSRIAGKYTGEIVASETWYPKRYSYKDGLREGTQGVGFSIGFNILREFVFPN